MTIKEIRTFAKEKGFTKCAVKPRALALGI